MAAEPTPTPTTNLTLQFKACVLVSASSPRPLHLLPRRRTTSHRTLLLLPPQAPKHTRTLAAFWMTGDGTTQRTHSLTSPGSSLSTTSTSRPCSLAPPARSRRRASPSLVLPVTATTDPPRLGSRPRPDRAHARSGMTQEGVGMLIRAAERVYRTGHMDSTRWANYRPRTGGRCLGEMGEHKSLSVTAV